MDCLLKCVKRTWTYRRGNVAITLIEVYQLIADVARQAQDWENKAHQYAAHIQELTQRVAKLEEAVAMQNNCNHSVLKMLETQNST